MADDPLRELITQMRTDLREDLAAIRSDIGRLVPREVYELRAIGWETRLKALEDGRAADLAAAKAIEERRVQQRRSDRRWVISAVIVPIVAVVLAYLLTLRGGA